MPGRFIKNEINPHISNGRRIVKVAKEFNVSVLRLVNILKEHGVSIDNRPTSKITDEQYSILYRHLFPDEETADKVKKGNVGSNASKADLTKSSAKDIDDQFISPFEDQSDLDSDDGGITLPDHIPENEIEHYEYNPNASSIDLFGFLMYKLSNSKHYHDLVNHRRLQAILFGNDRLAHEKTKKIAYYNSYYFDYKGKSQKKINPNLVYRDFPEIWGKSYDYPIKSQVIQAITPVQNDEKMTWLESLN